MKTEQDMIYLGKFHFISSLNDYSDDLGYYIKSLETKEPRTTLHHLSPPAGLTPRPLAPVQAPK